MTAALACVAALSGGLALQNRSLRVGAAALVPLAFMLIPLLQSIPLAPLAARASSIRPERRCCARTTSPRRGRSASIHPGRACTSDVRPLRSGGLPGRLSPGVRPDAAASPAACRGHRRSGRGRHRNRSSDLRDDQALRAVRSARPRADHRAVRERESHGRRCSSSSAFVCLACSFQRETLLNRIGWLVGTLAVRRGRARHAFARRRRRDGGSRPGVRVPALLRLRRRQRRRSPAGIAGMGGADPRRRRCSVRHRSARVSSSIASRPTRSARTSAFACGETA